MGLISSRSNVIEKIEHEGAAVWREVDQKITALFGRRQSRYGVAIDLSLFLESCIEAFALDVRVRMLLPRAAADDT
jgi:hypothetical protein